MKIANKHLTSAVRKAARGMLDRHEPSNRAISVYGFKNRALNMSGDELKAAWRYASSSMKTKEIK